MKLMAKTEDDRLSLDKLEVEKLKILKDINPTDTKYSLIETEALNKIIDKLDTLEKLIIDIKDKSITNQTKTTNNKNEKTNCSDCRCSCSDYGHCIPCWNCGPTSLERVSCSRYSLNQRGHFPTSVWIVNSFLHLVQGSYLSEVDQKGLTVGG